MKLQQDLFAKDAKGGQITVTIFTEVNNKGTFDFTVDVLGENVNQKEETFKDFTHMDAHLIGDNKHLVFYKFIGIGDIVKDERYLIEGVLI